jgi:polyhydroxyalkanoate synthase subunit PhaC
VAVPSLIDGLRRDVERSVFRARNGLKYVTGVSRPGVGQTPKQVVWQKGKARLYRYDREQPGHRRPVVICFSIMGRSYVLDLLPNSSFVGWLLEAGFDVFLLDFGIPDHADAGNTLETYVDGYVPQAVRRAGEVAGSPDVDLLGYCFGGVLATLAVAADPRLPVANLAVMATPVDFSGMTGVLQILVRGQIEVEEVLDDTGNVPAEAIHRMFRTMKPTAPLSSYATLWEKMWNDQFVEGFQAMSRWARDQVPFPGACARQGLDLLLRRNLLMAGTVPLGGREVQLAAIHQPLLTIVAEHDHLVPPEAARPLHDLVSSEDVTELLVPAGHIGLATGRHAVSTTVPGITTWLEERAT